MRNFKYALIIILGVVILGCDNEDDNTAEQSNNQNQLIGNWVAQDMTFSGNPTLTIQGVSLPADVNGEPYDIDLSLEFTENPNEYTTDGTFSVEVTVSALGFSETDNLENLSIIPDGIWEINNQTITFSSIQESLDLKITELTLDTLTLSGVIEDTVDLEGTSNDVAIDVVFEFIKS
mgnify:CR=1 FL=1